MIKNERVRTIVNSVFKQLDKEGYLTLHDRNIMCCSTCSWAKLKSMRAENKSPKPMAYAFYHDQNEHDLNIEIEKELYIGYGHDTDSQIVNTGRHIAKLFRANGVTVDWNGKADTKLKVKF